MLNQNELITRIKKGDLHAFKSIVNGNKQLVFGICIKMLNFNKHNAEDVSQEVFIKVFSNIKSFKGDASLKTWIAKIAYTTCLNFIKKNKKHYQNDEITENVLLTSNNPENILLENDKKAFIKKAVNLLPLDQRTILNLYHFSDFKYNEIAEITELPLSTVKSILFRARKHLKELLEKHLAQNQMSHEELR